MNFKTGVTCFGVRPETVLGMNIADSVYRKHGLEMTITSITEGKHSRGSLHYSGGAFDTRTRNIPPHLMDVIHEDLKSALGKEFDVVNEINHFHIEFQPKG